MNHQLAASERLTVSPAEAAALLGVSPTTVKRLLNAGTLRATKVGRRTLIRVEDLHALVAADPA